MSFFKVQETGTVVAFNPNPPAGEPLILLDKELASSLGSNLNIECCRFMFDVLTGGVSNLRRGLLKGRGCVVRGAAVEDVFAVVHTLLTHPRLSVHATPSDPGTDSSCATAVRPCSSTLILFPDDDEDGSFNSFFSRPQPPCTKKISMYILLQSEAPSEHAQKIKTWERSGGVLMLGKNTFTRLAGPASHGLPTRAVLHRALGGPDVVFIVSADSAFGSATEVGDFQEALKIVTSPRRCAFVETLPALHLPAFYSLASWVRPGTLPVPNDFSRDYTLPITNGTASGAEHDAAARATRRALNLVARCRRWMWSRDQSAGPVTEADKAAEAEAEAEYRRELKIHGGLVFDPSFTTGGEVTTKPGREDDGRHQPFVAAPPPYRPPGFGRTAMIQAPRRTDAWSNIEGVRDGSGSSFSLDGQRKRALASLLAQKTPVEESSSTSKGIGPKKPKPTGNAAVMPFGRASSSALQSNPTRRNRGAALLASASGKPAVRPPF